jgi:uncharacterized damage-inducible protein DinB
MALYNRTINERVYDACAKLTDEDRKRDRGAFFGSVHGTLNHLLWGDVAWLARFEKRPVPQTGPRTELHADFAELRAARAEIDGAILGWAEAVEPAWLAAPFPFYSVTYRRDRVLPAWLLVMQMFNHQTHHRGQLTTLLAQLGVDYGITDLPFMPFADELERELLATR